MPLTKTEKKIIDSINADGYFTVVYGFSDSPRGKSFGIRVKSAMKKLITKKLVVVDSVQKYTNPVYERFGGCITGTEFTTEKVLKLTS